MKRMKRMKRRRVSGSRVVTSTRWGSVTRPLYLPPMMFLFPWLAATATATAAAAATGQAMVETESVERNNDVAALDEVCAEFFPASATSANSTFSWQLSDCHEVWTQWADTVPTWLRGRYPDREMLRDTASEFRRRGNPCLVESELSADGVGSTTMRHLAGWMLAEELGCDWITPGWGTGPVDGNGSSVYCHRASTLQETAEIQKAIVDDKAGGVELGSMMHRCSMTNWLRYFNLDGPSVEPPANASFRIVEVDTSSAQDLESALGEVGLDGFESLPWDRLKLLLRRSHASSFLTSLGSWDEWKRRVVRDVLRETRANFHKYPRPWYDQAPDCSYGSSELNFALHLRMGDRREIEQVTFEYFEYLDDFMDTVTQAVLDKGRDAPMFHVFSEALMPCPSTVNGTFAEFPLWPVEMDQIPPCMEAGTPTECAEKEAGAGYCRPDRTGVFRVKGRRLVLHVGQDVVNALSCMIQADGLLMGCSTFGQLAGLLNGKGLSFFSTQCSGLGTAVQYKMIPPLAVAERGHMWVPVSGSWRDPVLKGNAILSNALEELLLSKGISR